MNSVKWNVISGTGLYIINVVIAFIMSPILVRALGNANYGLWDTILSLIGYMGLLDLGMGPALVRYVAVAHANDDAKQMKTIASSALFFFLPVGILAFLILAILGYNPEILFGTVAAPKALQLVFLLIGVNLLLQFPGTVLVGTLMGLQRHFVLNLVRAILAIIQNALIFIFLPSAGHNGMILLAGIEAGGLLIQYLVFFSLLFLWGSFPQPSWNSFSWPTVKELWSFGVKNSLLMLSSRLMKQSVPFVIGRAIGFDSVVFFSLPNRLVEYARNLALAMGVPLTPYFGALSQKKDPTSLKKSWFRTSLALQSVTLFMPLALWFTGLPFLSIWIGPEYAAKGSWVLKFLVVGLVVEALSPNAARVLSGLNRHGRAARIWLAVSVLFVPAAVVGALSGGVVGVAFASAVATAIGCTLTLYVACRELAISLLSHARETVMPLVFPLAAACALFICFSSYWNLETYGQIVAVNAAALTAYAAIIWVRVLRKETKVSSSSGP